MARWGRIDILINNAGILRDKSFGKMSAEDLSSVLDVHLTGSANCPSGGVERRCASSNYGRILMTTSVSGLYGNFGQANYGAAKMGIVGLMNTLCIEGAKNNIRVNCISPTAATRMTYDLMPAEMLDMLKPEFVTPATIFLASEAAPNRTVMLAGAGHYSTLEIRESAGIHLGAGERSAETIAARSAEIADMKNPDIFSDGGSHVAKILSAESAHRKKA